MARKGISQLFKKGSEGRPEITTIVPQAAIPGGEVLIRGAGFTSDHDRPHVNFGEVEATVLVSAHNFLIARVPDAATSNSVTVAARELSEPYEFQLGIPIAENLHPVANPAIDDEGNIYVTFSGSRGQKVPVSLFKIDLNYRMRPLSSDIMNPTGLAFDRAGYLFVSSRHDGTIFRVTRNGAVSTWVEGMGIATGVAFDCEENLYVGDRSGTIFKISHDRQVYVFATMEPSISAYHLAFGPDHFLYVTGPTTSSFDNVCRISPAGEVDLFYRGLGRPQGMAFDAEGNLYVAASLSGRKGIVRVSPDQHAELVISGSGLLGAAFAPSGALILASTTAVFSIDWPAKGWPLLGRQ